MFSFGTALAVSLVVSLLILRVSHLGAGFALDHATDERKLHSRAVPRIGGLAVFVAVAIGALLIWVKDHINGHMIVALVACSIPSFMGGLAEDLTGRVPPRWRLLFMAVSCVLAFRFIGLMVPRFDIDWLDPVLTLTPVALLITVFAMLTITNAVNLIDGMNGLAGMVSAVMFVGLGYVAFKVGDTVVLSSSLLMSGSIIGFLFWNYPNGHIFLGDGGAYFVGFALGALAILLVERNPDVSAFFPLLLLAYPLVEVAFSIYRRRIVKGAPAGLPDAAHLHQLIYKRVVRWAVGSSEADSKTRRNAMTAPYLWVLSSLAVAPAVGFYDNRWALGAFFVVFVMSYVWFYWRIVRMKVPRWMIAGNPRHRRHKD
jgi:UDP-N-acetylmuramyl pentapeptide phosphotransferase/UDP-N-acetylglucosamine-1-phosphate transferase